MVSWVRGGLKWTSYIFLVTHNILSDSGGLTIAAFNQSKLFLDNGHKVTVTTFDYQPNYQSIFQELTDMGRIYPSLEHLNKFEYYRNQNTLPDSKPTAALYEEEANEDVAFFYDSDNNRYCFVDGTLKKVKTYSDARLTAVRYFEFGNQPYLEVNFNKQGFVDRKVWFNQDGHPIQESFYTNDDFCYSTRHFKKKGVSGEFYLFNRKDEKVYAFKGAKAFDRHWLNELAANNAANQTKPIFIAHGQNCGTKVAAINPDHALRFFTVHSNHLEAPYTSGSHVQSKYKPVFENRQSLDGLVVLTEKQKRDILADFPGEDNIYVIPNPLSVPELYNEARNPLKVIMVTRLEKEKRLDEALHVFSLVVKQLPEATLSIFGKGIEEENLRNLIKQLKLENNVFLEGYSSNIPKEFQKASISMLTSDFEGLPLAGIESLMNGTPIVSYNFNYGASDIIKNGITGYIIEDNDKQKMAEKIIYLLESPGVVAEMSKISRENMIEKYTGDVVYSKWKNVLKSHVSIQV